LFRPQAGIWANVTSKQGAEGTGRLNGHDPEIVYQQLVPPVGLEDSETTKEFYTVNNILRFDKHGRVKP